MSNDILSQQGSAVSFKASGGSVTFTLTSLAALSGRVSAQKDWGAAPKPRRYRWHGTIKAQAGLVVGERLDLFIASSDGTHIDGDLGTADATFTTANNVTPNLQYIGSIVIQEASAAKAQKASGEFEADARYFSLVAVNNITSALSATAGDFEFIITPINPEVQ